MKKISDLKPLFFILCLLFFFNFCGCAGIKKLVEEKTRQNKKSVELTEAFCQDCKGPYCLKIGRIIFSSNKGVSSDKKTVILLDRGSDLTIKALAICCKWPGVARGVILQATISKIGTETDKLSDLRTGQWDNASVSFKKVPPGTYNLMIRFRASTMRGMNKKKFTLKVN